MSPAAGDMGHPHLFEMETWAAREIRWCTIRASSTKQLRGSRKVGFRDLLAQASGTSGFGSAVGRSVVINGTELGNVFYLGHGTGQAGLAVGSRMFDTADEMQRAGFKLYCSNSTRKPDSQDSSALSVHCRAASMGIATQLGLLCSGFFKKEDNRGAFNRAMGAATAERLNEISGDVSVDLFKDYAYMRIPAGLKLINKEAPGEGDLIGFYLDAVAKESAVALGFQRSGPLGFSEPASTLVDQTISRFEDALAKFRW